MVSITKSYVHVSPSPFACAYVVCVRMCHPLSLHVHMWCVRSVTPPLVLHVCTCVFNNLIPLLSGCTAWGGRWSGVHCPPPPTHSTLRRGQSHSRSDTCIAAQRSCSYHKHHNSHLHKPQIYIIPGNLCNTVYHHTYTHTKYSQCTYTDDTSHEHNTQTYNTTSYIFIVHSHTTFM